MATTPQKQPPHPELALSGSRVTLKVSVGDSSIVRETFSLPPEDSALIDTLRQRIAAQGVLLNRSEVLRAGLVALNTLPASLLADAANRVMKMKPGRPKAR